MEEKIFSIKPSVKLVYISAFINLGLFIGFSALLLMFKNLLNSIFNVPNFFGPIATIAFFIAISRVILEYVIVSTTYFTLTEKSFIMQTGFFTIKRENMELFRIVDISSSEPFIYRFLGLGNVTLRTIDKSDPILVMRGLENFLEIEAKLKEHASKKRPTVIESYETNNNIAESGELESID